MNHCEEFEMLASAFIDNELSRDETVSLLDHLVSCDSCRRFYGNGRSVQQELTPVSARAVPPKEAWQRIESRVRVRRVVPAWAWRAAAGIFLAIVVWQVAQVRIAPQPAGREPVEITLEESRGAMSDGRFVELTAEILRADRRYHQAMLQVMREVNRATGIERVSEESIIENEGSRETEGGTGEEQL